MSFKKIISASIVSSLILAISPISYFTTKALTSSPFDYNHDKWTLTTEASVQGVETAGAKIKIEHAFKDTSNPVKNYKAIYDQGTLETMIAVNDGNKTVRALRLTGLFQSNTEQPFPTAEKGSYFLRVEPASNIGALSPEDSTTTDLQTRYVVTYLMVFLENKKSCTGGDSKLTLQDYSNFENKRDDGYHCYQEGNMVTGADDLLLHWYINSVSARIKDANPVVSEAKLPAKAVDQCKDKLIQKESDIGWKDFQEIVKLGNNLASKTIDNDGKQMEVKNQFENLFQDRAEDERLYQMFYKDNGMTYSNRHTTKGDQLARYHATAFAEIDSWADEDLGVPINMVKSLENLLGAGAVVGGGIAAGSGAVKLSRTAMSKVGAKMAQLIVGQGAKNLAMTGMAQAATGSATTATGVTAGGGVIAAATPYAILAAIVIGGAVYGVDTWAHKKNRDYYKEVFESFLGYYYMTKHIDFHECITGLIGKTDGTGITTSQATATSFTKSILDIEKALAAQTADWNASFDERAGELNTGFECGSPLNPINWALCNIFMGFYEFGKSFLRYSLCLLENVVNDELAEGKEEKSCSACYLDPNQC